jgi:hypothetical protein
MCDAKYHIYEFCYPCGIFESPRIIDNISISAKVELNDRLSELAHPIILLSRENQNRVRIKTYRGSDFADRLVPFSLKAGFRFFDESHFDEP